MELRLSWQQIGLLTAYALGMSLGQILFKLAAAQTSAGGKWSERLLAGAQNRYFVAAIVLYATLSVLWVWLLTFTPLSRAYLFVALAFAVTPFVAGLVFSEPISPRLVVGIGFILVGLLCVAGIP